MLVGQIGKCKVVTATSDQTILEVAKLLKENNIGDIVVVGARNEPIGIITDRDIMVKIVACEVDPNDMTASDIMSSDLLILREYQHKQEALDLMCARGVRRAPIVNDDKVLIGIISADDLALLIADEMESYGKLIRKQLVRKG